MKIIGVTGGSGSGKSTVCDYLREKGFKIIDSDEIARDLLRKDSPCYYSILNHFGKDILLPSGVIDRRKLGAIVFNNGDEKNFLESTVTKETVNIILDMIERERIVEESTFVFVDAPLLFEEGIYKYMDCSWLVTADTEKRVERLMIRDGITKEYAMARIKSQMSEIDKAKMADAIIYNNEGESQLFQAIEQIVETYEHRKKR